MQAYRTEIHCRMVGPLETLHAAARCFPTHGLGCESCQVSRSHGSAGGGIFFIEMCPAVCELVLRLHRRSQFFKIKLVFNAHSGSMVTAPISMWSHQLRATAVPRFVGSEVVWLEEQDSSKGDGFPPRAVLTHFQSFV